MFTYSIVIYAVRYRLCLLFKFETHLLQNVAGKDELLVHLPMCFLAFSNQYTTHQSFRAPGFYSTLTLSIGGQMNDACRIDFCQTSEIMLAELSDISKRVMVEDSGAEVERWPLTSKVPGSSPVMSGS